MNRRRILTGLLAAPLVVRTAGLLMPVRALKAEPVYAYDYGLRIAPDDRLQQLLSRTIYVAQESRGLGDGSSAQHAREWILALAESKPGDRLFVPNGEVLFMDRPFTVPKHVMLSSTKV